jgi:hypothetical protein
VGTVIAAAIATTWLFVFPFPTFAGTTGKYCGHIAIGVNPFPRHWIPTFAGMTEKMRQL